jgi:hypothetical protein
MRNDQVPHIIMARMGMSSRGNDHEDRLLGVKVLFIHVQDRPVNPISST